MNDENIKENNEISLKDAYLTLVNNKKLYFIVSSVMFFVLMIIFLFILTPVYEVNASLEIRTQNASPLSINPMAAMLMSGVASNDKTIDYELLRSRKVQNYIIDKNKLQIKISRKNNTMFSYFIGKILNSLPEDSFIYFRKIPANLNFNDSGIVEATEDKYTVYFEDFKNECSWGTECKFIDDTIVVEKVGNFPKTVEFEFEYEHIIDTRERIKSSINIGKADESEMILLGFVHESPLMGSFILNDLVNSYMDVKLEWEKNDILSKKKYINSTLEELTVSLNEKSQNMIVFQQTEKTLMPELEVPELLKKQETLKIQIEELKFKKKIIIGALENIDKSPGTPITVPFTFEELATQEALKNHNTLLFKRSELSQKVTAEHPMLLAVEKEVEASTEALKSMLKASIEQYDRGVGILNDLFAMITSGQGKIPETLFTYARLKRDVQLAEQVFVTLSAKLYESAIEPNVGVVPVRLIDSPDPLVQRSFPKARVFAILILILTIFSGVLAIFIKEFFKAILKILE